jgi:hypothetical protein
VFSEADPQHQLVYPQTKNQPTHNCLPQRKGLTHSPYKTGPRTPGLPLTSSNTTHPKSQTPDAFHYQIRTLLFKATRQEAIPETTFHSHAFPNTHADRPAHPTSPEPASLAPILRTGHPALPLLDAGSEGQGAVHLCRPRRPKRLQPPSAPTTLARQLPHRELEHGVRHTEIGELRYTMVYLQHAIKSYLPTELVDTEVGR